MYRNVILICTDKKTYTSHAFALVASLTKICAILLLCYISVNHATICVWRDGSGFVNVEYAFRVPELDSHYNVSKQKATHNHSSRGSSAFHWPQGTPVLRYSKGPWWQKTILKKHTNIWIYYVDSKYYLTTDCSLIVF